MSSYRVTLIRTVEQAAVVTVEAGSEEEAMTLAPFEDDLEWVVDDITRKPETLRIVKEAAS